VSILWMIFLTWLIQCLLILLSVAFFTLFERKVIGLFHLRWGPNKVSFIGLIQPILDALKLFTKQNLTPLRANKFVYHLAPQIGLFLAYFVWLTLPNIYLIVSINYSLVLFFCVGSVMVFSVLMSGWSSNSKYSLIGSLRSVAQSISYESVFSTLVVMLMILIFSYSIRSLFVQSSLVFLFFFPVWVICTLAETHRAPFDFREAESELVSGFNTEYSGANFAFIFLSEYAVLLYSCVLITYIFCIFFLPLNLLVVMRVALFLSFVFVWIRITFCRFRYDILIMISWKVLLPLVLCIFLCFIPILILSLSII
jgi:NADH:ubiquinone oxidoreductase subunit H